MDGPAVVGCINLGLALSHGTRRERTLGLDGPAVVGRVNFGLTLRNHGSSLRTLADDPAAVRGIDGTLSHSAGREGPFLLNGPLVVGSVNSAGLDTCGV